MKTKKTAWSIPKAVRTKLVNELASLSKKKMKTIFDTAQAKNEKQKKKVPSRTLTSISKGLNSIQKEVKFPVSVTVDVTAYLGNDGDWVGIIDNNIQVKKESIPGLSAEINFSANLSELMWDENWLPDSALDILEELRRKYAKCQKRIKEVAEKYDMDPLELEDRATGGLRK